MKIKEKAILALEITAVASAFVGYQYLFTTSLQSSKGETTQTSPSPSITKPLNEIVNVIYKRDAEYVSNFIELPEDLYPADYTSRYSVKSIEDVSESYSLPAGSVVKYVLELRIIDQNNDANHYNIFKVQSFLNPEVDVESAVLKFELVEKGEQ